MMLMVVVLMVTRVESLLLHMQMSKHVWRLHVKKVHILPLRLFLFLSPFFVFAINTVCYKQKQNKEAKIVIWTIHCQVLHYNNEYWRLFSCVFSLTHSETVLSLMFNNWMAVLFFSLKWRQALDSSSLNCVFTEVFDLLLIFDNILLQLWISNVCFAKLSKFCFISRQIHFWWPIAMFLLHRRITKTESVIELWASHNSFVAWRVRTFIKTSKVGVSWSQIILVPDLFKWSF